MSSFQHMGANEKRLLDALYESVKRHCREHGDTQEALAQEMGFTGANLGQLLSGKQRINLRQILQLLSLTDRDEFCIELARIRRATWTGAPDIGRAENAAHLLRELADVMETMHDEDFDRFERECNEAKEAIQGILELKRRRRVVPMKPVPVDM